MALEKVRQPDLRLILEVRLGGHGEDLVELLERELLGFSDEAEDEPPGDEVEAGVEAEGAGARHDGRHAREGQAEHTGEGVVDADGPGHALFALDGGEDFGGVLEGYGAFAEGVADGEEVDE